MHEKDIVRNRLVINGRVQGVGFRPTVYRLALQSGLTGSVLNSPDGVVIEIQGRSTTVTDFAGDLRDALPPLAAITSLTEESLEIIHGEDAFVILKSSAGSGHQVLISPDTATCADCLADMADPSNRRQRYCFTNCTNCGPRFTITRSIPYDRATTSMACFPMCSECQAEYDDPLDRRFHAQPNACPACGPKIWLTDNQGRELEAEQPAIERLVRSLTKGAIAAVKGLGGFHLVCDATSETAVRTLRERKNRWGKPLAVMVPDLATAGKCASVSNAEAGWLSGIERPIVLLERSPECPLPAGLAPDTDRLGIMLPYTPLHQVLFEHLQAAIGPDHLPALVMTSGNMSSEPIALGNREALSRLGAIADLFLLHDRDILTRCDDSVVRVNPKTNGPQFFRRARGFTPSPVFLDDTGPCVLGLGPELKATICLTKNDQAFVSQHIGDLENLETYGFYQETIAHLQDILQVRPECVVADLHPDYLSSRYAAEQHELPVKRLQHHYAHIHAVLAENRFSGACLGLALDGTGLGEDRTLWGGECLLVDNASLEHERLGHFSPVLLPGGEAAVKSPWRTAQSYLHALGITEPQDKPWPWLVEHDSASRMVAQMLQKKINSPVTTSCGRLFDAVSAMLGLKMTIDYEGQAAICLEHIQDRTVSGGYACSCRENDGMLMLDTLDVFQQVHTDWLQDVPAPVISRRFHIGLTNGLADMAARLAQARGIATVALSGGVMQNFTLSLELPVALKERGLVPLVHREIPPNDACISLGQAVFGRQLLKAEKG